MVPVEAATVQDKASFLRGLGNEERTAVGGRRVGRSRPCRTRDSMKTCTSGGGGALCKGGTARIACSVDGCTQACRMASGSDATPSAPIPAAATSKGTRPGGVGPALPDVLGTGSGMTGSRAMRASDTATGPTGEAGGSGGSPAGRSSPLCGGPGPWLGGAGGGRCSRGGRPESSASVRRRHRMPCRKYQVSLREPHFSARRRARVRSAAEAGSTGCFRERLCPAGEPLGCRSLEASSAGGRWVSCDGHDRKSGPGAPFDRLPDVIVVFGVRGGHCPRGRRRG